MKAKRTRTIVGQPVVLAGFAAVGRVWLNEIKKWMVVLVVPMLISSMVYGYVSSDYTWYTYNGSEYAATFAAGPWDDVEAEAAAIGADLVTINDDAENVWLTDNFEFAKVPGHSAIWIGYHEVSGAWEWVSGEPVTYAGQLCNSCFLDPGPHMYLHTSSHAHPSTWNYNVWHDTLTDHYLRGIIEVPEPTTLSLLGLGAAGLVTLLRKRRGA